jgi:hypothetical protein
MSSKSDSPQYQANDAGGIVGEIFSDGLTIGQAIEKLRTRLLDLSARNGLLNFRLNHTGAIHAGAVVEGQRLPMRTLARTLGN